MKPEIAERWAAALESDKYQQTINALVETKDDGQVLHCAVGVLCELAAEDGLVVRSINRNGVGGYHYRVSWGMDFESCALPKTLHEWAGTACDRAATGIEVTHDEIQTTVIDLNDSERLTFPEIAQVIRKNFL